MKNVIVSDADLSAYSGEHLLYELQYLWFSASELRRLTQPSSMASVLIESFGIHLRNLIDFFCTPAGSERDDDVIASDFYPGWQENISDTFKTAKTRANKVLSHLTLERTTGQPWDVDVLLKEVMGIATRFAAKASPSKLSPKVAEWLALVNKPATTMAVDRSLIASNCTVSMVTSGF